MLYRILLVDDDELVLQALRRELLSPPNIGQDGLEIEAFDSPRQALIRVRQSDGYFDAVISDYRMPEMDGILFLEAMRAVQPGAARILLTAHADLSVVVSAINAAKVDFVVRKPWDQYDLKARIALALHQRSLELQNRAMAEALQVESPTLSKLRRDAYRVMLVDDEPGVLRALERELSMRGVATSGRNPLFSIRAFTRPDLALESVGDNPPDIVIADYLMPGMDGIAFLQRLKQRRPDAVRILLSGKATINVLLDAVNFAGVYHFLGKPWEADDLKAVMAEALKYHDVLVENNLLAAAGGRAGLTTTHNERRP
ncbi:MAG TPA: response regulator [Burkholderiales bacterium]|nr:response regulator [Burkholderiales bacterium]